MPSLILFMIAGAALFAFWNSSRAAAERADTLGRNACRAADVQWLDQSVHSTNIRIYRKPNGWLGFERTFRFSIRTMASTGIVAAWCCAAIS